MEYTAIFQKVDQLKAEIDRFRPLEKPMVDQVKAYYRVGLTYSSNALEGNSLTETETKVLLEDGITIGGKPLRELYEATGHARAYDYCYQIMHDSEIKESHILELHRHFFREIDENQAGVYRSHPVFISGSKYPLPPPERVPGAMNELLRFFKEESRYHPVHFAALVHKRFVFVHPFVDGNGRVARLLMNLCLIRKGCTPVIIAPVMRTRYIQSLEKAHEDDSEFLELIVDQVETTQRDLLRLLKGSECS